MYIYCLDFVNSLQKEASDKIAEVVYKESNNNKRKVFRLNKSHLLCLNPLSSGHSSWLNDHVCMLVTCMAISLRSYFLCLCR